MIAEVLTYSSPPMTRARLHVSRRGCWFEPPRNASNIIARYFARRYGIELTSRRGKTWTPRDIPGAVARYSSTRVQGLDHATGQIAGVRDRSGHGRHLVAPPRHAPTVVSANLSANLSASLRQRTDTP